MIGIIVFGTKGREKTVSRGTFFCPNCRHEAAYEQVKASRWFTLYFLPVLPMDSLGEWVRCTSCKRDYETSVLEVTREQVEATSQPWTCTSCGNVNPSSEPNCLGCQVARPAS